MDPLRIQAYKIHAIKKHKRQQFVGTLLLYSLTALACTLFCSSPLWYPPFCATFNVVFFISLPKICSFFFTSKVLFIVGNLIVIFLVGESKFFAPKSKASSPANYNDISYDKYKSKKPEYRVLSPPQANRDEVKRTQTETYDPEDMFFKKVVYAGPTIRPGSFGSEPSRPQGPAHMYEEDMFKSCCREEEKTVFEKVKAEDVSEEVNLPAEVLNRLADDFIARVNRQRRLEAEFPRTMS